jgi:predicted nucleic acid-binding protein
MRLFLDANILFTAAHNPTGKAALVIELGQAGLWQCVTSAYAVEEARRNLARKFPAGLERLDGWIGDLKLAPADSQLACPPPLPEKDCPIYRAAHACRADVLLTGDVRDFGFLMEDRAQADGMRVETVARFLDGL